MMTELARKTSLEDKHLYDCDYFAIVPSCSHFTMLTKNPTTGLVRALSKYRARNNFRIVSGHDYRPNSFLLGHVSNLAGQMYMMNYSFRVP